MALLVFAATTSVAAASTITWRVVAHGATASPSTGETYALVATTRSAASRIVARVPAAAGRKALAVDYGTSVLVGAFGPFGCKDDRVHVARIDESVRTLYVRATMSPLPPGTMECQAIFSTFRLLVIPRATLSRVPTRASFIVAQA